MTPSRSSLLLCLVLVAAALIPSAFAWVQLTGARRFAVPLSEDPGISWMLVTETPHYRVLRDFAEPGATRRMHHHEATWHVLIVATGALRLRTQGDPAVELAAGQSLTLKGGISHTFTSIRTETATIVEVFGKQ